MNSAGDYNTQGVSSPYVQSKIQEGMDLEMRRFDVAEQFPATMEMANVHYKANMFGLRRKNETRVCPCCLQRIKETQFSFCGTDLESSFLSSDIVLFFGFVRMLIYYFLLRFIITDAYNIYTNYLGHDCQKLIHCIPTIIQRLAVVNKISHIRELFIVDLLNFAFVGISIIYFSSYDRYLYNWFYNMSVSIQTEDDFSVFITNIPILQDVNENQEMEYIKGIENYLTSIVKQWLNNPKDDMQLYDDYVKVSMNHQHAPQNPPKIITKINLCWDLYELTRIGEQKQRLQEEYQKSKSHKNHQKRSIIYQDAETMYDLRTLNRAGVDLCQQFETNHYYGFVVSKFLGKAFVSFEYQHFALIIYERLAESEAFLNHKLKVFDADPPRDVYWQNLNVTRWQRLQKLIITFFICAACLVVAFLIVFGIKYRQKKYQIDQVKMSIYKVITISIFVSLFTLFINWVLKIIIKRLVQYEQHDTRSKYDVAVIHKTIISVICNQILNPFLVNIFLKNVVWSPHGLVSQITYLLVISLLIQLVKALFHYKYLWYWIKLKYHLWSSPPILKFQDNFNLQYALPDFEIHERYIFYLDELYLISFYAYIVPEGSLIGVLLLVIQYFADKYTLLKHSSFHPSYSYSLVQKCLILAQSSVLVFAIGNYFNSYIYYKKWFQPLNLLSILIALVYTILVWIEPIRKLCIRNHTVYEKLSYTQCAQQYKFFHTYYGLNPATKLTSDNRKNKLYLGVNHPVEEGHSVQHVQPGMLSSKLSGF